MTFGGLLAILIIYSLTTSIILVAIRLDHRARKALPMRIAVSHIISLGPKLSDQVDKLIDALSGSIDPEIEKALESRAEKLEALTKPKEN